MDLALKFAFLFLSAQVSVRPVYSQQNSGCQFNLDTSSPAYPPHIVDENLKIVMPVMQGTARVISLAEGQRVTVSCFGTGNVMKATNLAQNPMTCNSNSNLLLTNGTELPYAALGCKKVNSEILVEKPRSCANGKGALIKTRYQFGDQFISLYDMCHDKDLALNYYSINTVYGRSANAGDRKSQRPTFSQDGYYPGLNVNQLYTQVNQTETLAQILGSRELANFYIKPKTQYFLSRGHLAPNGDFIDADSQRASFYFMNAAPQFQTFNGGNWRLLEEGIRNEAFARQVDLTIYTGTFSVMTLVDIKGVPKNIYLAFDGNNNGLIPAPKYYWKLIHEPISNTATAVIGINSPYVNPVKLEDIICPDVCDQIPWVKAALPELTEISKGYTFCCSAADLHKAIAYAPDLNVPLFGVNAASSIITNAYISVVTLVCLFAYRSLHA